MTSDQDTWALHTDLTLDEVNLHLAALDEAGVLGIAEQDGAATVYLRHRVELLPVAGHWERIAPRDWNAEWRVGFQPVTVGDITVSAPWHDIQGTSRITLVIEPAQAFGTGHHETTTACLAALQALDVRGRSVFDVGTGTGVLALAAKALGADVVLAVDVDPLAVEAASANAARHDCDVEVRLGSADAAQGGLFDVVVANIDTATLTRLAPALAAATAPDGSFVGSGISNERADEAVAALRRAGLRDVRAEPGDEWTLLLARGPQAG